MIIVVGVNKTGNNTTYNVLVSSKGKYEIAEVPEHVLKDKLQRGMKVNNVELKGSEIVGTTGSIERFNNKNGFRPFVILSRLVDSQDNTLGYRISDYKGVVKAIKLADILAYAEKVKNNGLAAIQNAIYVEKAETTKAFIKSFNTEGFPKEVIAIKQQNNNYRHTVKVSYPENKKNISKISEIFNPKQIEQLKMGKANGVNIALYANKSFSAEQMQQIREGLEKKIKARLYADPKFSVVQMSRLKLDMIAGIDVSDYANPVYSNGQMTQLKLGKLSGVDISLYANPKTSIQEMSEIRTRLEMGIWCDCEASKVNPDNIIVEKI